MMRGIASRWLILLALLPAGCVDVRGFAGAWSGSVLTEEAVRQGIAPDTRVDPLLLEDLDLQGVKATLTLSDGKYRESRLTRVIKSANDTLASLSFDGSPLRSYLLFAPLEGEPQGWPALVVISLFADDHVELRLLRGNDLFGVFHLRRRE